MTLPAFSEAYGIAAAVAKTNLPYILSFVIRGSGALLDGTPLHQAIEEIDATLVRPPTGYAVNCVHPTIFLEGLTQEEIEKRSLTERIVGFAANTSATGAPTAGASAARVLATGKTNKKSKISEKR